MGKKRFVITIDEEQDDFIVETPDGEVGLDYLIDILDLIVHDLSHVSNQIEVAEDEEEATPTENKNYAPVDKKDLN